ncbi:hypothetical protein WT38_02790 [Burkholderia territorii]|nr:hypothetical protein WT38_02790 [Burkholderia territorii]
MIDSSFFCNGLASALDHFRDISPANAESLSRQLNERYSLTGPSIFVSFFQFVVKFDKFRHCFGTELSFSWLPTIGP